jgi:hypothetical protein
MTSAEAWTEYQEARNHYQGVTQRWAVEGGRFGDILDAVKRLDDAVQAYGDLRVREAQADTLAVLRAVEWLPASDGWEVCPICQAYKGEARHHAGCKLAALLEVKA